MPNQTLVTEPIPKDKQFDSQMDTLCAKIEQMLMRQSNILLISAPGKERSRSIVTSEVAKAMADRGKNVLLVDSDFEYPTLHEWFRMPSQTGLADLLLRGIPSEQLTRRTGVEGLSLLAAGSEEKVVGRRLSRSYEREFIKWRTMYDLVLIQTPPHSPPLSILLNTSDGALLMVKEKKDKMEEMKHLAELYKKANKPIVGVIYQKL